MTGVGLRADEFSRWQERTAGLLSTGGIKPDVQWAGWRFGNGATKEAWSRSVPAYRWGLVSPRSTKIPAVESTYS
jgi:hypothetical protein